MRDFKDRAAMRSVPSPTPLGDGAAGGTGIPSSAAAGAVATEEATFWGVIIMLLVPVFIVVARFYTKHRRLFFVSVGILWVINTAVTAVVTAALL